MQQIYASTVLSTEDLCRCILCILCLKFYKLQDTWQLDLIYYYIFVDLYKMTPRATTFKHK